MNAKLRDLHPELRPLAQELLEICEEAGLRPRLTSVYRSSREQKRLYEDWIRGRRTLPAAPPGRSLHEHRLAFDLVVEPRNLLREVGRIWEELGPGFRWGGRFKNADPVHFEYRPPGF